MDTIPVILGGLRVIFGFLMLLFVPGFVLSLVIFPRFKDLGIIERLAYSTVMSIGSVIGLVLFMDVVLGINTKPENILIVIGAFSYFTFFAWLCERWYLNSRFKTRLEPQLSADYQKLQRFYTRELNAARDRFRPDTRTVVVYHEHQQSGLNHIDHSYLLDIGEEIAIQQVEENKLKVTDSVMLQPPYPTTRYFELEIREYTEEALSLVDDLQIYPVLVTKKPDRKFLRFVLQRGTTHISERIHKKTSTTEVQWIYSHDFHIFAIVNAEDTLGQMVDRIMGKLDEIALSMKSGIHVSSQAEERQILKDTFEAVIEQPRAIPARPREIVQLPEVPFSAEPSEIPKRPVVQATVELSEIPERPVIQPSIEPKMIPKRPVIQPGIEPREIHKRPVIQPSVEPRDIPKRPVIQTSVEPKMIPKRPVIQATVEPNEIPERPVSIEPRDIPKRPVVQTGVEPKEIPKRPVIQPSVEPRDIPKRPAIQTSIKPTEIPKRPVIQPSVEPRDIPKRPVIQPSIEPQEIPKRPDVAEDEGEEEPWEIKERQEIPAGDEPGHIVKPPEILFSVELMEIFKHSPKQHRVEPQDILRRPNVTAGIEPKERDRRELQKEILRDLDVFGITPNSFGKSKKNIENIIIPKKADVDKKLAEIQEDEDIDWLDLSWLYED